MTSPSPLDTAGPLPLESAGPSPLESAPSIAIVGASNRPGKFGNAAVRAFLRRGYRVFPVNPRESTIAGLRAYASVRELPRPIDIVTVYVPSSVGLTLIEDIARLAPRELWLNPGAESDVLIARARELGLRPIVACSLVGLAGR